MSDLKKEIIRNSLWSFFATAVNRVGTLIFSIVLARVLMPENFGLYSIVLSVAMLGFTFADLGINKTLVRYISLSLAKNRKNTSAYYKYILKIKLVITLCITALLLVLAYPLSIYAFKNEALFLPLIIAAFYVFVLSLEGFYAQLFYSAEKIQYLATREILSFVLKLALLALVFYVVSSEYYLIGVFFLSLVVSLVLFLFSFAYSKKLIPELSIKSGFKINKKKINRFIGFLTIASISGAAFSSVDSIMLGLFLPPEYVGYYRAAFSLVLGVMGFVAFPNLILLPIFTRLGKSKTRLVFNYAFKYMTLLAIPSMFALWVMGSYFIRAFFSYEYLPATFPLRILSLLIFPFVGGSLLLSLFSSKEKTKIFAELLAFSFFLNLVLNFLFIKSALFLWGPIQATDGAALATTLSWFIYFILAFRASKKSLNLKLELPHLFKPLVASIIMAIVLWSSIKSWEDMTILSGVIEIALGVVVYFITLFLIKGITFRELKLFRPALSFLFKIT